MTPHRLTPLHTTLSLALLLGLSGLAQAQAIYRIVGPDGRVTFSDQPPSGNAKGSVLGRDGRSSESASTSGLPFELKKAASAYPVTLYTGNNCAPCESARAFLSNRGIPFAERTVNTPQDGDALKRLSGDTSLPLLTIGGKKVKGFLASEWTQYLDAAGYPSSSQLPSGYRNPAATPLVATDAPKELPLAPQEDTPPPPPAAATPDNPTGIQF